MLDSDGVSDEQDIELRRPVTVRLVGLDEVEAKYTNLLNVNFDRASFQVVFSQFFSPVILTPDDAARVADQGFVPARVIARMVFTPLMIEQTIDLLKRQLDAFNEQFREEERGKGANE